MDSIERGWNRHLALSEWTTRVDTKASILLALEVGLIGFVVTQTSKDGLLSGPSQLSWNALMGGLACLSAAILLSAGVVLPHLRGRDLRAEHGQHTIYFGHLRHWGVDELAGDLRSADEASELSQLSRQLVMISKMLWRKHRLLQWSVALLIAGATLVGVSLFS